MPATLSSTTTDCETIASLPRPELSKRLRQQGLWFHTPPYTVHLKTPLPQMAGALCRVYAHYPLASNDSFADFHIHIRPVRGLRRYLKAQIVMDFDGHVPFHPMPARHAFPLFEWGLNWCIGSQDNNYAILHAAVLARNGHALVMPGEPGAGKSTLTAALSREGFRLLSDELTLLTDGGQAIQPVPRPVSLKNASIDIIRQRYPDWPSSETVHDTTKGSVAHFCPSAESIAEAGSKAMPALLIFPRYQPDAATQLSPIAKSDAFMRLIHQAFNYNILGQQGFDCCTEFISRSDCYEFRYSQLDEAIDCFHHTMTSIESDNRP